MVKITYISWYFISGNIEINQLWKGGSPNLNKILRHINSTVNKPPEKKTILINNNDTILWEIKYLIALRELLLEPPPTKIGITHNILTSKQIHWETKQLTLKDIKTQKTNNNKYK